MKIAIIGAGNVGAALGQGLSRVGHRIIFGSREPDRPDVQALAAATDSTVLLPQLAAAEGEVVIIALPWRAAEAALPSLGDLTGKIVVDAMNPLGMTPSGLSLDRGFSTSGGELVAELLPGARVVKTLNQVGAEVMADTSGFSVPPVMLMAGDDSEAKALVAGLLRELGFEPLDAGGLIKARILEPFGFAWINQAILQGKGRDWAFGAMTRQAKG